MKTGSRESPAKGGPSKRHADPDDRSEPMSDPARRVPEPAPRDAARPDGLDGFPGEGDAARERGGIVLDPPGGCGRPDGLDAFRGKGDAARERVDITLDRPPLNVITMTQREQLRVAFEAADA